MMEELERSRLLLGKSAIDVLKRKKIIIFGLGGVGSFVSEALIRTGVYNLTLVDNDIVSKSNINRQIIALQSTIGKYKVDVMKERILDINPKANVKTYLEFYLPEKTDIDIDKYDYIIDAIDTISSKIELAIVSYRKKIKIISSMGCANRLDPTKFKITDIYKTSICPVCKVMRYELRKRCIPELKVVYSTEKPKNIENFNKDKLFYENIKIDRKEKVLGSVAFVPSVAGFIIAQQVVMDLIEDIKI